MLGSSKTLEKNQMALYRTTNMAGQASTEWSNPNTCSFCWSSHNQKFVSKNSRSSFKRFVF